MKINEITFIIIEDSIYIHKNLGPGLFEKVYEEILYYRLIKRGMAVSRQTGIPVNFEDVRMEIGFRADLIVENQVLVEIKSMESLPRVSEMQTYTYLKLTNLPVGLLINFNTEKLKDGLKRIVNRYIDGS